MSKAIFFSVAGVGVAGAGGFGVYTLLKDKPETPFFQRIDTKKRIILDTATTTNAHDPVWTEIAKEYEQNGNIKEIPKDSKVKENLKQYCQDNRSSTSSNSKEFEQYTNYCTRENLMTKLSTSVKSWNTSKDEAQWETSKSTYTSSGSGDLLIPKDNGNIEKMSVTKADIMNYCETISTKPFINNVDADYKRGEKWCTVNNG